MRQAIALVPLLAMWAAACAASDEAGAAAVGGKAGAGGAGLATAAGSGGTAAGQGGAGGFETSGAGGSGAGSSAGFGGGGASGMSGAGGDGGAGGATGCVDIALSGKSLSDPALWAEPAGSLRPDALWFESSRLHVGWLPRRKDPSSSGSHSTLAISSFSAVDGATLSHQTHDLKPDSYEFSYYGLALRETGDFAISYAWVTPEFSVRQAVALGRLGKDATQLVDLTSPLTEVPTGVGWDGEAWAVHVYAADAENSRSLYAARVSEGGSVLLPFTRYGYAASVGFGPLGHKTITDPLSGRSYVFDASFDNFLNGHDRQLAPLFGAAAPKVWKGAEPSSHPSIAVNANGLWVAWSQSQSSYVGVAQRLSMDGDRIGEPLTTVPPPDGIDRMVVLPLPGGKAWFAASSEHLYGYETDGMSVGPPTLIAKGTPGKLFDLRDMAAYQFADDRWLYYSDANAGVVHVIKIVPGCVYGSP